MNGHNPSILILHHEHIKVEYNQYMSSKTFEIRICQNCGLRYPLVESYSFGERCPNCLGLTETAATHRLDDRPASPINESNTHLDALLDNIRSVWNAGSIFRTADGFGINKLYLCGITPTPKNENMRKTSLGAEKTVTWEYSRNGLVAAKKLKTEGNLLIGLEQDIRAKPIDTIGDLSLQNIVLVIGNEVTGVDPDLLDLCDHILYIPMYGQKSSFNVEVAFAIAAYALRSQKTYR
jgi:tRNA G18 (ribose-2'-O)-methylase SpoU